MKNFSLFSLSIQNNFVSLHYNKQIDLDYGKRNKKTEIEH